MTTCSDEWILNPERTRMLEEGKIKYNEDYEKYPLMIKNPNAMHKFKWITDRNPNSSGFYGVLLKNQGEIPYLFSLGFWNGSEWLFPGVNDCELDPHPPLKIWVKLQIGSD